MVWFPAQWVPHLLRRLQTREDEFRREHALWFDQDLSDEKLIKRQPEAKACRTVQFGVRQYPTENLQQLTCSLRVDWFSLPVESFREKLQTLKKGVVAGVFQAKAATPWEEVHPLRLQVSLFLFNEQNLDQWYDAVCSFQQSWPELAAMNSDYMQQVTPARFKASRRLFHVPGMWGKLVPQWDLLEEHLYNTQEELAGSLVLDRSRIPGGGNSDATQPVWQEEAWLAWEDKQEKVKKLRKEGPVLSFCEEQDILQHVLDAARRDATLVKVQFRKLEINTEGEPTGVKRQKKEPLAEPVGT